MKLPRWLLTLAAFAGLLAVRPLFAEASWQVDVVTDMTDAGRKKAAPTPAKPAYYFPVVGGYREAGGRVAGEKPPQVTDMIHHLAKALAAHGFIATRPVPLRGPGVAPGAVVLKPQPSLILVFNWGYLNPETMGSGTSLQPTSIIMNQEQMLRLVGGSTLQNLDVDVDQDLVLQGIAENRYFVTVAAFDLDALRKQHKKVLLWITRMSVASQGVTMDQVMPTLIASGGPLFGRETTKPQWIEMPVVPNGRVEVGQPELKGYIDATPPPAPAQGAAPAGK